MGRRFYEQDPLDEDEDAIALAVRELREAMGLVDSSRNSGDGSVRLDEVDDLTEAAGRLIRALGL